MLFLFFAVIAIFDPAFGDFNSSSFLYSSVLVVLIPYELVRGTVPLHTSLNWDTASHMEIIKQRLPQNYL